MTSRKWTSARVAKVWLDVVLVLGGVGAVLLVVWIVISPWMLKNGLPADTSAPVAIGTHALFPRLQLEYSVDSGESSEFAWASLANGYAELRTATTDWRLHFASVGSTALATFIVLYAIWTLREVLRTVLAGEPFAPANSQRLRRIGCIVLVLATLAPFGEYWLGQVLLEQLTIHSVPVSPAFRVSKDAFLIGILFLVLAAIFSHGTRLEEERSLTV